MHFIKKIAKILVKNTTRKYILVNINKKILLNMWKNLKNKNVDNLTIILYYKYNVVIITLLIERTSVFTMKHKVSFLITNVKKKSIDTNFMKIVFVWKLVIKNNILRSE